jgi:uncharacterized circularly permuted ATP-grasp superfamily protein
VALSYDEVYAPSGEPRPHTEALAGALSELGREELADAGRRRDAIFMQQGITFDAGGPDVDGPVRDRPFPLDLVPRVIPAAEWTQIKRGLAQRIRALDRFSTTSITRARSSTTTSCRGADRLPPRVRARGARHPPARRGLLPRLGL